MLLNTLNKEKLYESLAEVFSISVQQMKEYIKTNTKIFWIMGMKNILLEDRHNFFVK